MKQTLFSDFFDRHGLAIPARVLGLVLLALVLIGSCTNSASFASGDACTDHTRPAQQSCQQRRDLDQELWQAQINGLPGALLQPLYASEAQVMQDGSSSYALQSLHYQQLERQTGQVVASYYQEQARALLGQFHREAESWGQAHPYADAYDKHSYALDIGYMAQGIGTVLDTNLASAHTVRAYQAALDQEQAMLFNLHMFEQNYSDKTAFNAVHQTDGQVIAHYHLQRGQVLLISLAEQALRVYQDGRLVKALLVTTGRPEHPSLPGVWPTKMRFSPMIFVSPFPQGSPDWFPPTYIHYAILYHFGGYYIHDAWWRANYGPGTQFPHPDGSGDTLFSNNGSHGCINLPEQSAAWLYQHTDWNTTMVIY